ncbi:hypothetical protein CLOM_g4493 [Closterium sp. NIES-68]|nr:hypothetical protein CLOM_g4487 [Closterium sp. NIES-68]GJP45101.1 hypothetical protein CLOM_g4493 [Closterium sp. NIES-68]
MASWWNQLAILGICALVAVLVAPAAAKRPSKEEVIAEVKSARDALKNPAISSKYRITTTFLDHFIPKLESDWNPTDETLGKLDLKAMLFPADDALLTSDSAGAGVSMMLNPNADLEDAKGYWNWLRANMVDGLYSEQEMSDARELKDVNGRKMGKSEDAAANLRGGRKMRFGKANAQINDPEIFKGKFLIVHGVDALQSPY